MATIRQAKRQPSASSQAQNDTADEVIGNRLAAPALELVGEGRPSRRCDRAFYNLLMYLAHTLHQTVRRVDRGTWV